MSGLVGYNRDFALTLSQKQTWKVLSKGVTWAHLCFKKVHLAVLWKIDWREVGAGRNESREASEEAIAVN